MTVIAPEVTSLRISKLSANQVQIAWDDVGDNFYYFVEIAKTQNSIGEDLPSSSYSWSKYGIHG